MEDKTMKIKRNTLKVSKERAKQIILNTEPALTRAIVDRYTDSELKEWMKLLNLKTNF